MKRHKHLHTKVIDRLGVLSYNSIFTIWVSVVASFALIYFLLSYAPGQNGPSGFENLDSHRRFWNAVYYSIITATSVGYGDIVPLGFAKVFAALESMLGLGLFALFMTKLVSHRQEIALREVHKLSFEDIFHNMREDFYITRNDFDAAMNSATRNRELTDEEWIRVSIAYRQVASLLQEIPDFYDGVNNLYTIDNRREEILQESMHRTLHRINQMLDVFSREGIDWVSQEGSVSELRELTRLTKDLVPLWREKSPYNKTEAFEQILHLTESIRTRLKDELPVEANPDEESSVRINGH